MPPIMDYTTKIGVGQSLGEIREMLGEAGAATEAAEPGSWRRCGPRGTASPWATSFPQFPKVDA